MKSHAYLQQLLRDTSEQEEAPSPSAPRLNQNSYVVAIIQNRAKEVGLAALDTATASTLWLSQYVEATRSFINTMTMLELYPPSTLLVVASKDGSTPDTGLNGVLAAAGFELTHLPRGAFDDSEGTVLVQNCAIAESDGDTTAGRGSYLALGAAGALLKFMREERGMALAAASLTVSHALATHHAHIDAASIEALELVQPAARPGGGPRRAASGASLFAFLNGTRTKAGAQLLRANLLQPLRDIPTLEARYDALHELMADPSLAATLGECLGQLPKDMDSVCGSLVLRPAKTEGGMMRRVAAMVKAVIQLRELLGALGPTAEALAGVHSALLAAVGAAAGDPDLGQLLVRLEGLLDDEVRSGGGAFLSRTQQCFALRGGEVPLLDVARQAFCTVAEAAHAHAEAVREAHGLPGLKVRWAARRGFFFCVPLEGGQQGGGEVDGGAGEPEMGRGGGRKRRGGQQQLLRPRQRLPSSFSLLQSNGRVAQVTTDELNALNGRLRDAANDCLCLTEEALEGVAAGIVADHLPALHRLIDGLALLDVLCGFAGRLGAAAEEGRRFVRPALTPAGPLALVGARHPVLEAAEAGRLPGGTFQPNDTWLAPEASLHVISGPNMAGKSTYLRQVALAAVMAQVGCHVAADFASLAPVDRILTRMGTADAVEAAASSFMVEMQETAHVMRVATSRSLVLIDELGRATSTADGLGVARAVAEALAARGARTLLATHFAELAALEEELPQARAFHFDVEPRGAGLRYTWRLAAGRPAGAGRHYGLDLAAAVAFPEDALQRARDVVAALDAEEAEKQGKRGAAAATAAGAEEAAWREERAVWEIAGKMACLAQAFGDGSDEAELAEQLAALQAEAAEALGC